MCFFFFFKPKTAYEVRNSDLISDVFSFDLRLPTTTRTSALGQDVASGVGEGGGPATDLVARRRGLRRAARCPDDQRAKNPFRRDRQTTRTRTSTFPRVACE